MVRRGSTVRVRQRASRKYLLIKGLGCPRRKRLSRAGTRGHDLEFPRPAHRHIGFGLFKRIRTGVIPSVRLHGHAGAARAERRWSAHDQLRPKAASSRSTGSGGATRPASLQPYCVAFDGPVALGTTFSCIPAM